MFHCNKNNHVRNVTRMSFNAARLPSRFGKSTSPFPKTCSIVPYICARNEVTGRVTQVMDLAFRITIYSNFRVADLPRK